MQELLNIEHLQEMHHFAQLGRMSAVLLHEISNPLAAAMINLEAGDHTSAAVRRARRDMLHMKRYIEAARLQLHRQGRDTIFGVQPQLDQLKRILTPLAARAGVQLDIDTLAGCRLKGDPIKFQQIISNLIANALDAYQDTAAASQVIEVRLTRRHHRLIIKVKDQAGGIAAENLPKLFDEFYTTKTGRAKGLGLGLTIVKQYATDFGGSATVRSGASGTCFTVKLPALLR